MAESSSWTAVFEPSGGRDASTLTSVPTLVTRTPMPSLRRLHLEGGSHAPWHGQTGRGEGPHVGFLIVHLTEDLMTVVWARRGPTHFDVRIPVDSERTVTAHLDIHPHPPASVMVVHQTPSDGDKLEVAGSAHASVSRAIMADAILQCQGDQSEYNGHKHADISWRCILRQAEDETITLILRQLPRCLLNLTTSKILVTFGQTRAGQQIYLRWLASYARPKPEPCLQANMKPASRRVQSSGEPHKTWVGQPLQIEDGRGWDLGQEVHAQVSIPNYAYSKQC